ncbi:hypothetical protein BIW11_03932 [Tropilaelaps mercedesae]|uniref:Uncharacterized protein n=1 Tax=Tropilaelaps mercedesae TaxID=418985 RepID=A0A1V9XDL0_9ACAR|nr:hypothetical protein BIW11_03932 [Tropilaelaps mercedesae]
MALTGNTIRNCACHKTNVCGARLSAASVRAFASGGFNSSWKLRLRECGHARTSVLYENGPASDKKTRCQAAHANITEDPRRANNTRVLTKAATPSSKVAEEVMGPTHWTSQSGGCLWAAVSSHDAMFGRKYTRIYRMDELNPSSRQGQ